MYRIALVLLMLPLAASAQGPNVKIISSCEQGWSGGIAGRHGTNYSFVVEFSKYKKANEPVPDTLWVGQEQVLLSVRDSTYAPGTNTRLIRYRHAMRFEINAGTAHDEYNNGPLHSAHDSQSAHAPAYNGAALLSYHSGNRQYHFVIGRIMKHLPPLNYP